MFLFINGRKTNLEECAILKHLGWKFVYKLALERSNLAEEYYFEKNNIV